MSKDFDPDWKWGHVTRAGRPARILSKIHGQPPYAYAASYVDRNGFEQASTFTHDGHFWKDNDRSDDDLINAPAPKRKFVRWVNMYASGGGHDSKRDADGLALSGRIACVRVEFEEGDGL